jgi:hypothetical protein
VLAETTGPVAPRVNKMAVLRRRVARLVADNMEPEEIAVVMGLSIDKLRVVFDRELQHGRALMRAEELFGLQDAGDSGSVSALKHLEGKTAAASGPMLPFGKKELAADAAPPRLGKKLAADAAAVNAEAGTSWENLINPAAADRPN